MDITLLISIGIILLLTFLAVKLIQGVMKMIMLIFLFIIVIIGGISYFNIIESKSVAKTVMESDNVFLLDLSGTISEGVIMKKLDAKNALTLDDVQVQSANELYRAGKISELKGNFTTIVVLNQTYVQVSGDTGEFISARYANEATLIKDYRAKALKVFPQSLFSKIFGRLR